MDRRQVRKRAVKRIRAMMASFQSEGDVEAAEVMTQVYQSEAESDSDGQTGDVNINACEGLQVYQSDDGESDADGQSYVLDENTSDNSLNSSLCDWAVNFNVSLVALTALLTILRMYHPFLPKNARTLLTTKTVYKVQSLGGGKYFYFGILESLSKTFERVWSKVPDGHVFRLQLNIDGLPLFKSSKIQFWPILGLLQGHTKEPVIIALFCGTSKPSSRSDYFRDLVNEIKILGQGFIIKGKHFLLRVSSVICDAPARAFVKGIKSHTGYLGCDKCIQTGVWINHRMTFPEVNSPCRTDTSFISMSDEGHHTAVSPLTGLNIGMVTCFPHDYMHLVCLGVMRKLLDLWHMSGPVRCRISARQSELISNALMCLKDSIPVDFARKPRHLSERQRWKATELRQFLLYTGPVVLRDVLAVPLYQNCMLLSVSIFILSSSTLCLALNDFAHSLLVSFVQHYSQLYGPEHVVYNIHGLTHLCEGVRLHGNLNLISGFPFENYLGQIKKMIRTPHHPLSQVIRRLSEINSSVRIDKMQGKGTLRKEHKDGPVPTGFKNVSQFQEVVIGPSTINICRGAENCVKIGNSVALVMNIVLSDDSTYIVYKEYEQQDPFFDYPIISTDLGIFVVSNLSNDVQTKKLDDNIVKYAKLPYKGKFIAIPLLHTSR